MYIYKSYSNYNNKSLVISYQMYFGDSEGDIVLFSLVCTCRTADVDLCHLLSTSVTWIVHPLLHRGNRRRTWKTIGATTPWIGQ